MLTYAECRFILNQVYKIHVVEWLYDQLNLNGEGPDASPFRSGDELHTRVGEVMAKAWRLGRMPRA